MPPDHPPNNGDERDERLAALLEVPPLDDVTRRRLVRRALDEPGAVLGEAAERRRRTVRVVGAAAAALVVVVGATVVLRAGDDGGDTTVAGRDRTEKAAEPAAGDADEAVAAPTPLGDIGEVSDPAVLRERLTQRAATPPPAAESVDVANACAFTGDELGTSGPFTLTASGTYQGAPAAVFVASKGGIDTAFVIDAATCEIRAEVPLV